MEIGDLFVSQLRRILPLDIGESTLEEITDKRLKGWAVEICADVCNKESDLPCDTEQGPGNPGDNKTPL